MAIGDAVVDMHKLKSMSPISLIRWVFTLVVVAGILEGLLQANIQKLAEQQGWDKVLANWWGPAMDKFGAITTHPWWWYAVWFSTGVTTALWLVRLIPERKKWTESARLTLVFDNELNTATPTKQEGVRWYYWYSVPSAAVDFDNKKVSSAPGYIMVCMSLNDPTHTNYEQIKAVGGGIQASVLASHAAGASVRAIGDMRGRTLDIRFSKFPIPLD